MIRLKIKIILSRLLSLDISILDLHFGVAAFGKGYGKSPLRPVLNSVFIRRMKFHFL